MLLTVYACYALKNSRCNATAAWPRNILHRNFPTSTLCIYKNTPRWGRVYFLADGEGFPRTALARRLRGNRDDLTALHWSNLLVVEQGFSSAPPIHKINAPLGRVYFWRMGRDSLARCLRIGCGATVTI